MRRSLDIESTFSEKWRVYLSLGTDQPEHCDDDGQLWFAEKIWTF